MMLDLGLSAKIFGLGHVKPDFSVGLGLLYLMALLTSLCQ